MKFIPIVLFLFASRVAAGQVDSATEAHYIAYIKGPYNIDYSNHSWFFKRVVHLVDQDDPDSLSEAKKIIRALNYYDSVKYSYDVFMPLCKRMDKFTRSYVDTALVGRWRFAWGGTNWGDSFTAEDTSRQLVFTGSELIFYTGDTVKRKTGYRLVNEVSYYTSGVSWYARPLRIRLADSGEEWSFQLTKKGRFGFNIKKTLKMALHLDLMPNCVCGCPEEMYNKL